MIGYEEMIKYVRDFREEVIDKFYISGDSNVIGVKYMEELLLKISNIRAIYVHYVGNSDESLNMLNLIIGNGNILLKILKREEERGVSKRSKNYTMLEDTFLSEMVVLLIILDEIERDSRE